MKNVTLEPLSAAHLPMLTALWRDPDVIRYTNISDLCGPAEAVLRLDRLLASQAPLSGPVIFAVLEGGVFQGVAGCPPVDVERGTFGLFYQLLPRAWGRGVGRSAARLTLAALDRAAPSAEVLADVVAENTASVRILESLGFRRTAVRPGAFHREGRVMDIWDYTRCPGGKEETP